DQRRRRPVDRAACARRRRACGRHADRVSAEHQDDRRGGRAAAVDQSSVRWRRPPVPRLLVRRARAPRARLRAVRADPPSAGAADDAEVGSGRGRRSLEGSRSMQLWRRAVAVSLAHGFSGAQAQTSGADLFNSACAHCHGENGQGGPLAPSILQRVAETDDAELIAFLRVGAPNRGMPPAPVTGEQMTALVDYLRFLGAAADSESGPDPARAVAVDARIAAFRPVTDAVLQNPDDAD